MVSRRKVGGSKLTKLKKWVDLPEAARYLSDIFGEEVGEPEVLRLALDSELKLSVYIYRAVGKRRIASSITIKRSWGTERFFETENKICQLEEGVYDLPLIGLERNIVNLNWQKLSGGSAGEYFKVVDAVVVEKDGKQYLLQKLYFDVPPTDSVHGQPIIEQNSSKPPSVPPFCRLPGGKLKSSSLEKQFVSDSRLHRNDSNVLAQDCYTKGSSGNYGSSNCFPEDSFLVVRTSVLHELKEKLDGEKTEQPVELQVKKDITKSKKQNNEKQSNKDKKKSDIDIIDRDLKLSIPSKEDEDLPLKGQAVSESGYLRIKQIIGSIKDGITAIIPVSRATWYAGVKSGRFPKQVKLSDRTVGWKKSEIMALQEELEKEEE